MNARNLVCWAVVLVAYFLVLMWGSSQPITMERGRASAWARLSKRLEPVTAKPSETGVQKPRRQWTPTTAPAPPATRAEAEQVIQDSGCKMCAQDLLPRLQRAIRLGPLMLDEHADLPKGASRFGGDADVPAGFEWPHRKGQPLDLIAQLKLSEIAALDEDGLLPKTGWLCFFYALNQMPPAVGLHPNDRNAWQVIHFDGDAGTLTRMSESPSDEFPQYGMRFWQEWNLPFTEEEPTLLKSRYCTPFLYTDLCWTLAGRTTEVGCHRLLGYPESLSDAMRPVCQMASNGVAVTFETDPSDPNVQALVAGTKEWTLLLQVDLTALEKLGLPGGMSALGFESQDRLYYWIRTPALRAADFNQVWVVRQGSIEYGVEDQSPEEE